MRENEDESLEVLQLISNPKLTKEEQRILTNEYNAMAVDVEVMNLISYISFFDES